MKRFQENFHSSLDLYVILNEVKNPLRFGGVLFADASYIAVQLYLPKQVVLPYGSCGICDALNKAGGASTSPTDFVGDGALDVPWRKVISKSEQ